jgi:hypothetical protein
LRLVGLFFGLSGLFFGLSDLFFGLSDLFFDISGFFFGLFARFRYDRFVAVASCLEKLRILSFLN